MKRLVYNSREVIQMARTFPVIVEQDESGYFIVTCPILSGCYSQGKTLKEALENIKEAIELCLEELDEKEIPDTNNILISQVVV